MSWFTKPNTKEEMRANERALRKANRELNKDRRQLEEKEKELEAEIRKLAKKGQRDACAVVAKQLLQLRKQKTKSISVGAKMSAVGAQNRHVHSVGKMAEAFCKTANTMKVVERKLPANKLAKNMQEFTAAQEHLGITEEVVSDTLDSMLDESGDEEEQDAIISQVLDEIGVDFSAQISKAPKAPAAVGSTLGSEGLTDADLEKMLANLRS